MNPRTLVCSAALLCSLIPAAARSETPAPAAATAPADAIKAETTALIERVKAKLQAGQTTEAALSDELKAFDELLAKHAPGKTNEAAKIGFMKAMLYLQVFNNQEAGLAQLKQVGRDFPDTEVGQKLPEIIAQIEADAAAEAHVAIGKPFAPFKETATDGSVIDLAAYKGKVVLVDFWATWCGPCVDELPHVLAAYRKHHDEGFEIIGISLDKDADKLAAFTKENQMPWPQYFDGQGWKNKLAQAYGIRSIPATFLLDREGKIVAKGLRGDALSAKVAELLATAP